MRVQSESARLIQREERSVGETGEAQEMIPFIIYVRMRTRNIEALAESEKT